MALHLSNGQIVDDGEDTKDFWEEEDNEELNEDKEYDSDEDGTNIAPHLK